MKGNFRKLFIKDKKTLRNSSSGSSNVTKKTTKASENTQQLQSINIYVKYYHVRELIMIFLFCIINIV